MDEVSQTTVTTQEPAGSVRRTVTTNRRGWWEDFWISKTNQIIFSIIGIIDVLLLFRFSLLLLGANRTGIVQFLLDITHPFVAPFIGVFASPAVEGAYFETASLMAIIGWLVLGFILATIIGMFSTSTETPV